LHSYETEITQLRRQIEALGASPVVAMDSSVSRVAPAFQTPAISSTAASSAVSTNSSSQVSNSNLQTPGATTPTAGTKSPAVAAVPALAKPPVGPVLPAPTPGIPSGAIGARFPTDLAAAGMLAGGPGKMVRPLF
jgi:hypothetical protein